MSASRRITGAAVAVLLTVASAAGLPPEPAAAANPAAPNKATAHEAALSKAGKAGSDKAASITLVTGDVVRLTPAGGGRFAATVRPGPGRERISFSTTETADGVRVVPSDVVPMLADKRLDGELFDVRHLIDEGYGDAATTTLPLIVQSAQAGVTARALAATGEKALPSIGAVALRADKGSLAGWWRTQIAARENGRRRIWLDARVKPALDRSTGQIGAPAAWAKGLDGRGVKVAVLDTGIDASHPDLAGRIVAARDFSGSADATDHFGHGTHVASIVAGAKGVAPGAGLLVGKVLDDSGSGYESSIIEGMQWAAGEGARVVNLSLGGGATDGTDPMSAAVDEISAAGGTLFVVAAGNEGADSSIGTPGAATSALTVGAVDRDDSLADFSSRGPRVGDLGLKPEITAPGVEIVAARAAGTDMGHPVDALHTAASGTSMATPHVAGAAAILAQQHPQWTGARLKNALVSTAKSVAGTSVYGQGAGRVDVARAIGQAVTGTGVADFGLRATGESRSARTVTYTNDSAAPVTLTLRDDVAAVTATPSTVTVAAGGAADVTVTFDPAGAATGRFSGRLTATGPGGVVVTTAIGGTLDPPHHRVTFTAIGRDGRPANVPVLQVFGDDPRFDVLGAAWAGEPATVELAAGDYFVDASVPDGDTDVLVTIPELTVDQDRTVVLDARKAHPVRIETPRAAENRTVVSYYAHRVTGSGREIANGFMSFGSLEELDVTPTAKLRRGSFEFSSRWQLVAPLVRASVPGVAGPLDVHLDGLSPARPGIRRFDLVAGLGARAEGRAAIVNYPTSVEEAAAAGAAMAVVVMEDGVNPYTSWQPVGDRLPIPSVVVSYAEGQRLLARTRKPGATITTTLTPSSPYLYDVMQVSRDRIPDRIVHRVTAANSRRITTRYADNGGFDWIREQRFGWRPWQDYSWNDAQRYAQTPSQREEWVSTGDSIWQHQVHHAYPYNDLGGALDTGIHDRAVSYPRPGTSDETWYSPITRPAAVPGTPNTRTGDVLNLRIAQYVDATDRHWLVDPPDSDGVASARLFRNGALLADLPDAWRDVPIPAGDASYRLVLTTARDNGDDWIHGTATTTEWSFRSARAGSLPLLQISYAAPVSLTGLATSRPHRLDVTVPGARDVRLETSADDGRTWRTAPGFVVPAGHGPVSVRVTATDRSGSTVRQTVIRAYGRS